MIGLKGKTDMMQRLSNRHSKIAAALTAPILLNSKDYHAQHPPLFLNVIKLRKYSARNWP